MAARACLARCNACERCNFVSFSRRLGDCSWYARCDTVRTDVKHFRSGPALKPKAKTVLPGTVGSLDVMGGMCLSFGKELSGYFADNIKTFIGHLRDSDPGARVAAGSGRFFSCLPHGSSRAAAASFLAGEAACAPQGLREGVMTDSKRVGGYRMACANLSSGL